jgi:hypothetical protein
MPRRVSTTDRRERDVKFGELVDKAWEDESAEEIPAAPPSALEGLSEKHDEVLEGLGWTSRAGGTAVPGAVHSSCWVRRMRRISPLVGRPPGGVV